MLLQRDKTPPQVLLVKPKPKQPGDETPWVLPRGSRQYRDAHGRLHDVRNDKTALEHKDRLEPLADTVLREAEEEAGVPPSLLRSGMRELGVREYQSSPTSTLRHIHWYVLSLGAGQVARLNPHPADAFEPPRWVTLDGMRTLAAAGTARAGYISIVEEVLEVMK